MAMDEPFGADERTIQQATAGGANLDDFLAEAVSAVVVSGLNPLVAAAAPLFVLISRLRNQLAGPNVLSLHAGAISEIKAFESRAGQAGIDSRTIVAARYALCATIDDLVLNTPWGSNSPWTGSSMVTNFHREAAGGERFFALLDGVRRDPARNLHLLEMLYVCLALSFEGRYRLDAHGPMQLSRIRDEVAQTIRNQRGQVERDLSPRWKGVAAPHRPLAAFIPAWVSFAAAVLLALLVYLGLSVVLNDRSNVTYKQLAGLPPTSFQLQREAPPPPPPPPDNRAMRLQEFLADEIQAGLVAVLEDPATITVRIAGRGMFGPGSDRVEPRFLPLIEAIGQALEEEQGRVVVTGHSDNTPIRSARFPSNYHLSQARAETVRNLIANWLSVPSRVTAEGMADTQPIADNETPAGREKNRRIEVVIHKLPDNG